MEALIKELEQNILKRYNIPNHFIINHKELAFLTNVCNTTITLYNYNSKKLDMSKYPECANVMKEHSLISGINLINEKQYLQERINDLLKLQKPLENVIYVYRYIDSGIIGRKVIDKKYIKSRLEPINTCYENIKLFKYYEPGKPPEEYVYEALGFTKYLLSPPPFKNTTSKDIDPKDQINEEQLQDDINTLICLRLNPGTKIIYNKEDDCVYIYNHNFVLYDLVISNYRNRSIPIYVGSISNVDIHPTKELPEFSLTGKDDGSIYNDRSLYIKTSKKPFTIRDFYNQIKDYPTARLFIESVKPPQDKDEIKSKNNASRLGFNFERLWDIIIRLGLCDKFPRNEWDVMEGNVSEYQTPFKDFKKYFDTLTISGNSGGKSDITLKRKDAEEWIFVSCKYYLDDDKKSVDDYDVEKIRSMKMTKFKNLDTKYKIWLFINNKQKLHKKLYGASISNTDIKEEFYNESQELDKYKIPYNILDIDDLEEYYTILRNKILDNTDKPLYENNSVKKPLVPLFHQSMLIEKTIDLIGKGYKEFLWGWKPRSGKTFGAAGLVDKLSRATNKYNTFNVLVITPVPNETKGQFEEVFKDYSDFEHYEDRIHNIKSRNEFKSNKIDINKNNIFIFSKQLLQEKDILEHFTILNINFDIIIFDENHYGGTTNISKNIVDKCSKIDSIKLFLTGTFNKTIQGWNIPEEARLVWYLNDEKACKDRNLELLKQTHGEYYINFILQRDYGNNVEFAFSSYDSMPDLCLITNMFDNNVYETIIKDIKDTPYGFNINTLFTLYDGEFKYKKEVQDFLSYISGSNKIQQFKSGDKSIFSRIKNISLKKGTRTDLTNENFTSQLWFLPFGHNLKIDDLSQALKKLMLLDKILRNYEILILNSNQKIKDVKKTIAYNESQAKKSGKDGLIILAGAMCVLGISLKLVDIVVLLTHFSSSDQIVQMIYRALTDDVHPQDKTRSSGSLKPKKLGYVVEMDSNRVLEIVDYIFTTNSKVNKNIHDKIKYVAETEIISIDPDMFDNKTNKNALINKLLDMWEKNPENQISYFKRQLQKMMIFDKLSSNHKDIIKKVFGNVNQQNKKEKQSVAVDPDNQQEFPDGKIHADKDEAEAEGGVEKDQVVEKDKQIDFNKLLEDCVEYIIPFIAILTYKTP